MSGDGLQSWSQLATDNATADASVFLPEGQPANSLNDAVRDAMASIAKWRDDNLGFLVATRGIGNVFALTTYQSIVDFDTPFEIAFQVSGSNTGPSKLQINGLDAKPLYDVDGTELYNAALLPNIVYRAQLRPKADDGDDAYYLTSATRVIAPPVVYVRTDGNDNNDGSDNTPDRAYATIQAAITGGQRKLPLGGKTAAVVLGIPGTYPAPSFPGSYASADATLVQAGTLIIQSVDIMNGVTTTQDQFIIQGAGQPGMNGIIHVAYGSQVILRGLTIKNDSATTYSSLAVSTAAAVYFECVTFSGAGLTTGALIFSADGAVVKFGAGVVFAMSAGRALHAQGGGITQMNGARVTIRGSLTFAYEFARAEFLGRILCPGASGFTVTGTVTGTRYYVDGQSTIQVFGGGANYFPGTVAGSGANYSG